MTMWFTVPSHHVTSISELSCSVGCFFFVPPFTSSSCVEQQPSIDETGEACILDLKSR